MVSYTENFGLTKLDPGESIHAGGGAYPSTDRDLIDSTLHSLINHRHTGESAADDAPETPPVLELHTTGGTIPAGVTVRYKYTYLNPDTGESLPSLEATVTTRDPLNEPLAPAWTTQAVGGTLDPGTYYYVLTSWVGSSSVETKAQNAVEVTIPQGSDTNQVTLTLPELETDAEGFNIYRRSPGQTRYYFLAQVGDVTEYVDTGSGLASLDDLVVTYDGEIPGLTSNFERTIPQENTTFRTNSVEVTLPGATPALPAGITQWKLYRTYSEEWNASFLGQYSDATTTVLDVGAGTGVAAPPNEGNVITAPPKVLLTDGAEVQGILPGSMVGGMPAENITVSDGDPPWKQLEGETLAEILAFIDEEGVGGGSGNPLHVLIAHTTSPVEIQNAAEYVCDGVDDHVEIESALELFADAPDNQDFALIFAPGDYWLGRTAVIPDSSSGSITVKNLADMLRSNIYDAGNYGTAEVRIRNRQSAALFHVPNAIYNIKLEGLNLSLGESTDHYLTANPISTPAFFTMSSLNEPSVGGFTTTKRLSAPADSVNFDTEIDLRWHIQGWYLSGNQWWTRTFFHKASSIIVEQVTSPASALRLTVYNGATPVTATSSVGLPPNPIGSGSTYHRMWIRITCDLSEAVARFWYSINGGETWVQLGTDRTFSSTPPSSFADTGDILIGSSPTNTNPMENCVLYRAEFYPEIDGSIETSDEYLLMLPEYTDNYNAPTKLWANHRDPFVVFDGTTTITGPTSLAGYSYPNMIACIAPTQWASGSVQTIGGEWTTLNDDRVALFQITATGHLSAQFSPDGTAATAQTFTSTVPVNGVDGEYLWVAVSGRRYNNDVQFFTSTDGFTFTQLGTTLTVSPAWASSFTATPTNTVIGSHSGGTEPFIGRMKYFGANGNYSWMGYPHLQMHYFDPRYADEASSLTVNSGVMHNDQWTLSAPMIKSLRSTWNLVGAWDQWGINRSTTEYSRELLIENCNMRFTGSKGTALTVQDYFTIKNCTIQDSFKGTARPSVFIRNSWLIGGIEDCYLWNGMSTPLIQVDTGDYGTAFGDADADFHVSGCFSDGNSGPLFEFSGYLSNMMIHDNTHLYDGYQDVPTYRFTDCQLATFQNNQLQGSIEINNSRRIVVDGNTFDRSGVAAIDCDGSRELTITNNSITEPSTFDTGYAAIRLADTDHTLVSGNSIHSTPDDGDPGSLIRLEGTSSDNFVTGNIIRAANGAPAIEIGAGTTPTATHNTVTNNAVDALDIIDSAASSIIEGPGDNRRIRKSADQTLTTDTLTEDNDLEFSVVAGRSYIIEGMVIFSSSEASGISFDWGLGATPIASVDWTFVGEADANLDGAGVGVKRTVTFRGTVTATASGTIPLMWAQTTTEATPTDTTVYAGSHIEVKRLY